MRKKINSFDILLETVPTPVHPYRLWGRALQKHLARKACVFDEEAGGTVCNEVDLGHLSRPND